MQALYAASRFALLMAALFFAFHDRIVLIGLLGLASDSIN